MPPPLQLLAKICIPSSETDPEAIALQRGECGDGQRALYSTTSIYQVCAQGAGGRVAGGGHAGGWPGGR